MSLRTLLIDDDKRSLGLLSAYLDYAELDVEIVGTADDPIEGLKQIRKMAPDVVFLDVCMPGKTGFELMDSLEHVDFSTVIISAHEQYAIDAYQHHAFHYLLKPFTKEEVKKTIERLALLHAAHSSDPARLLKNSSTHHQGGGSRVSIGTAEGTYLLETEDVIHCEGDGSYTYLHLRDGRSILASHSIGHFEHLLEGRGFLRVHKSHLVNLKAVEFVNNQGCVFLRGMEKSVPASYRKRKTLMEALQKL